MKKRILALILALTMTLAFAACGTPAAETTPPANTGDVTNTPDSNEPRTLTVAALDSAYGVDMWHEVVAAFEALYDDVTVTLITDKKLEDVIGPSMKAGNYPDVVHLATGRPDALTETFIKDNAILEITDVFGMTVPGESAKVGDKVSAGFNETSLTNPYGGSNTYLAPMFYSPCGLFYNAGLFTEKGWDIPETWDEMWELGDKAAAEGIALFCYPTAGYFDAFLYALLFEVGGPEFFAQATSYAEGIWDTPEAQQAFAILEKLASYTEKTVPANANNDNFTKNQQLILDNKALFIPNGSWLIGEMADAPRADGFEWGFMALPAVSAGGDRYSFSWFEQLWVPAGSANQDLAKEFVAFMYSDKAVEIFASHGAIQPVLGVEKYLTEDNKVYYSIYDTGAKPALGGFAATEAVEGLDVHSVWFEPVNSLVSGDKTVDEWIASIKSASDIFRSNLK